VLRLEVGEGCIEQHAHVLISKGIENEASVTTCLDDAVRPQESQRVGHGGLADLRRLRKVADAILVTLGKLNEKSEPTAIRQHREEVCHHAEMLVATCLTRMSVSDRPDARHMNYYI
jgi:hypothetical protein